VRRSAIAAALASAIAAFGASPVEAECPSCGSVSGSVTVEQAYIRTDGPKHDRDVVVMLEPVDSEAPAAVETHATMDQTGLVFVPHVLAIPRGATVTFLNNDKEQHNVYFLDDRTGNTLDIGTWGPGVSVDHSFDTPGMVITLCKLHLEMAAYVVVSPSPWFAKVAFESSDAPIRYEIVNVPPGDYELSVWHKKLKHKGGAVRIEVATGTDTEVDLVITKSKFAGKSR
jgi:plastocyanin